MVDLFSALALQSSLSQLVKTVLSLQLAPLSQLFATPLVNQRSCTSAKAMFASVSPLRNVSQVFVTLFQLAQLSQCRRVQLLRF
jgi:hypothetical protein